MFFNLVGVIIMIVDLILIVVFSLDLLVIFSDGYNIVGFFFFFLIIVGKIGFKVILLMVDFN